MRFIKSQDGEYFNIDHIDSFYLDSESGFVRIEFSLCEPRRLDQTYHTCESFEEAREVLDKLVERINLER